MVVRDKRWLNDDSSHEQSMKHYNVELYSNYGDKMAARSDGISPFCWSMAIRVILFPSHRFLLPSRMQNTSLWNVHGTTNSSAAHRKTGTLNESTPITYSIFCFALFCSNKINPKIIPFTQNNLIVRSVTISDFHFQI